MVRRGAHAVGRVVLALAVGVVVAMPASAQAIGRPEHLLYEWHPAGSRSGPQLVLEDKVYLTGKFGVQCGKSWYFAIFGAGPWTLDTTADTLSGTGQFPSGSVGMGSTYRNSEINYFDFKSAGPVTMTLSGTATYEAAVGTLALKVYRMTKARELHGHRIKAKKVLSASCAIPFDAPNFYYEPPVAEPSPEAIPPESSED
jgi:hypothetical protein